jgi:hypothetical protein
MDLGPDSHELGPESLVVAQHAALQRARRSASKSVNFNLDVLSQRLSSSALNSKGVCC